MLWNAVRKSAVYTVFVLVVSIIINIVFKGFDNVPWQAQGIAAALFFVFMSLFYYFDEKKKTGNQA